MPYTFQGIDPSTTGRTGVQAKQYLEGVFGSPLNNEQITQAGDYLNTIGYTDRTGAAQMTGAQWNQLMQEAARRAPGGAFQAWQTPTTGNNQLTLGGGPDAPIYTAPTLDQPAPYQAPTPFQYEAYQSADPFSYDAFRSTTAQDLYTDPSYQWRTDQGRRALESSAAAKGLLRTGGSMTDLINYGQQAASQEFGNVDARRRADYQLGYGTSKDIYDTNVGNRRADYATRYGVAKDTYDTNTAGGRYAYEQGVDRAQRAYDARVQGSQAEYAPKLLNWQAGREDRNRAAELNFDRQWQRDLYERDDAFRRERAGQDDRYRDRTYDTDHAFRQWLANLQNTQFLAELGTRN